VDVTSERPQRFAFSGTVSQSVLLICRATRLAKSDDNLLAVISIADSVGNDLTAGPPLSPSQEEIQIKVEHLSATAWYQVIVLPLSKFTLSLQLVELQASTNE
jgi:hypothetical protein